MIGEDRIHFIGRVSRLEILWGVCNPSQPFKAQRLPIPLAKTGLVSCPMRKDCVGELSMCSTFAHANL